MNIENLEQLKQWALANLITRKEAAEITGQSYMAFSQSVNLKNVVPFLEYGSGTATVRLYLKSDIEAYAKQLKAKKEK